MRKGPERSKRKGRRSGRSRRQPPKLIFLCDKHIEPSISQAVGRLSGCQVSTAQQLQVDRSNDTGYLKDTAIRLKAVILTRDRDFVDLTRSPVGKPPGILRLDLPGMPASEAILRLQAYLTSEHRNRCKNGVVILGARTAEIRERRGRRIVVDTVPYYEPLGEDKD